MRNIWQAVAALHCSQAVTSLAGAGALALAPPVFAQPQTSGDAARVEVSATGLASRALTLTGFAELPERLPFSISTIDTQAMRDLGATSLADLLRSEPAVSDAYNTLGYPENFAIRGIAIDPRLNYRLDGMPIHGHVPLALENAERIVVLKGVSGLLAGSSSPGGMVDLGLKRAGDQPLRSALFALSERASRYFASDLAERFGAQREFGVRVNFAAEERRPMADNAPGDRRFASAFVDWRVPGGGRLEWHAQRHLYSQISVPGASLLDGRILPPVLPRRNMNDQAWSAPFESRENLSGLRWIQPLGEQWVVRVSGLMQRIRTHDRIAFPDGCSSGPEPIYPGFCANGDADLYDFRSLDERRSSRSLEARLEGILRTAGLSHEVSLGYRQARLEDRFPAAQAYNWVGTSNYFSTVPLLPDPEARTPNTNRNLGSREWSAQDRIRLRDGQPGSVLALTSLWLGLRGTEITSTSTPTDGVGAVGLRQSFVTPFAALSVEPRAGQRWYLSYGEGIETEVVPNRPQDFANPGQALAAQRSTQWETGFRKGWGNAGGLRVDYGVTAFRIDRPRAADLSVTAPQSVGVCGTLSGAALCRLGGLRTDRHQGLEFVLSASSKSFGRLDLAAQGLQAEVLASPLGEEVGSAVRNVAPWGLQLMHRWPTGIEGLEWQNRIGGTGRKPVLVGASRQADTEATAADPAAPGPAVAVSAAQSYGTVLSLPAQWQWDSALSWRQDLGGARLRWTLSVVNLLDRKFWREGPTQPWGGVYLFPAPPRTMRLAVQAHW